MTRPLQRPKNSRLIMFTSAPAFVRRLKGAAFVSWTAATFLSAAWAVHSQLVLHARELGVSPSELLSPKAEVYVSNTRNPVSLLLHPSSTFNLASYFSVLLWIVCSSFLIFTALFVGRLRRVEAVALERQREFGAVCVCV